MGLLSSNLELWYKIEKSQIRADPLQERVYAGFSAESRFSVL